MCIYLSVSVTGQKQGLFELENQVDPPYACCDKPKDICSSNIVTLWSQTPSRCVTYFQSCADSAITWYVLPSVTILKAFSFSPLSKILLKCKYAVHDNYSFKESYHAYMSSRINIILFLILTGNFSGRHYPKVSLLQRHFRDKLKLCLSVQTISSSNYA